MMRLWVFLIAFNIAFALQGAEILSQITSQGYYEFENRELSAAWYDDLYDQFDLLVEEYQRNADFRETLDCADREFGTPLLYGKYSGGMFVPTRSKQPQLTFFRYCRGYRAFLEKNYPHLLEVQPLRNFFCKCHKLVETSDEFLFLVTQALDREGIHALPALLGDREYFATALKVVRYDPGPTGGLGLHSDVSGLTLLLDCTDEGEEALIFAPHKENLEASDFGPPQRKFSRTMSTSVLLIPGAALKNADISLEPTLHGVLPVEKIRYAVLAFAMVPIQKDQNISN